MLQIILSLLFCVTNALAAQTPADQDALYKPTELCMQKAVPTSPIKSLTWKVCRYKYPNSGSAVLWYFHGFRGDEHTWRDSAFEKSIIKQWIDLGLQPPIVLAVTFKISAIGEIWFMSEKNSRQASGAYDVFLKSTVPTVKQYLLEGKEPTTSYLMGVSMGGFNGAQLYFKQPQMFQRAALICPMVTDVTNNSSKQDKQAYMDSSHANGTWVNLYFIGLSQFFDNDAAFMKDSPLELAKAGFSPMSVPLYVSDGLADPFGFQKGDQELVNIALGQGAPVESNWYPDGGHCIVDPTPIVEFLTRPALLEKQEQDKWLNEHL